MSPPPSYVSFSRAHTSQPSPPPVFIGGIPALEAAFAEFVTDSIVNAGTDGKRKKSGGTKARSPAKRKAGRDQYGDDAFDKTDDQNNLDAAFAESVNDVDAGTVGKRKKSGGKNARSPAKRKAGRDQHGDDATDKTDDQNNSLVVRLPVSPPRDGRDEVMPSYVGVTMEAGVPKSRRPKQRKRF